MKRSVLKKLSPSKRKAFIRKADRAIQDHYRATFPEEKCESCGAKFNLMHHVIEKSKSSFLRFCPKNLVFLCFRCHALHHNFGDSTVMARVAFKRGRTWFRWLEEKKRITTQLNEEFILKELRKLGISLKN